LKKGNNEKFAAAMQKAVELDPKNKLINYNLATAYYQLGKYDEAKKYYEKTIELDPKYVDAYKGIAFIILAPEEGITKEMNKDEVLMNDALYNKYNKQRLDLYRKVLPVLEKALSIAPNDQNVLVMLKKIYRDLDMKDKYNEVKAKLDAMK
jgi:tetratricopeptide (TPR) repeat protein